MSRNHKKKSPRPQRTDNYAQLAHENFSELNALLYQSTPSTYFRMRLASAAMHLRPSEEDRGAANERSYGALTARWSIPEDDRVRTEFVALEITVLLHHAVETMFRLYLAHIETPNCPWLEVTRLVSFVKFKEQLDKIRKRQESGFDRSKLGIVLLGGKDPEDAGLDIAQSTWDEHLDASQKLLVALADRLLSEAHLYNTAKHGLAGVVDSSTRMEMQQGETTHVLNDGPVIAYPRRSDDPDSTAGGQKWQMSMDSILIDTDMATVELVCKYIDSITAAGRRRYTGKPGEVWICNQRYVLATLLQGKVTAGQLVSGVSFDLATAEVDSGGKRSLSSINGVLKGHQIQEETFEQLDAFDPDTDAPTHIPLPELERFRRVTVSEEHLLPISPTGSQSRLAHPTS